MTLSAREKIRVVHKLIDFLQLRLLDKEEGGLPSEGKYYFPHKPHEVSTIGSLAAQPTPTELYGSFPPAPNSMGMFFLVIPNAQGIIEFSVSGHFDLEHAYIPNFDDMCSMLIMQGDSPRDRQDVLDAFLRFELKFTNERFEIDITESPSGVVKPIEDRIGQTLDQHVLNISQNPRIFRKLRKDNTGNVFKKSIPWDDTIIDQKTLNQRVSEFLFEPNSTVMSYNLSLECNYRYIPSLTSKIPGKAILIELHFVNHTLEENARKYRLFSHRIMDVEFTTVVNKGSHTRMQFNLAPQEYRYRDSRWMDGYGQACGIISPGENILQTQILPRFEQPWLDTPSAELVGMQHLPKFELMAVEPIVILDDLVKAMNSYLSDWDDEVVKQEKDNDPGAQYAREDIGLFKEEIARVQLGIDLLTEDEDLLRAFMIMNRVMGRAVKKQGKSFTEWRLFQLAFIVTQLGSVKERHQEFQAEPLDCENYADVLWFATGGGKTEAYLGIITVAMFYQRFKQRTYGVTAWLRFPLRMLSVQQFQRLSYVIGQANEIKTEENIPGHPFTVGYFTGRGTPNRISSTADYAQDSYLPNILDSEERKKELRFINRCPHCDSQVDVEFVTSTFRIKHVCQNNACWSNTQSPLGEYGEGTRGEIGIFVSDEEIYRYLPTVLVGTLDKLAVLGHNSFFHKFFGHSTHYCPDHGFILQGSCKESVISATGERTTCSNNSRTSAIKTKPIVPMIDPGFSFLITDELHLLGESLGNFDAHYETLLVSLQKNNGGMAPKVLSATATIREYENHIHHLYLRYGRRFPVAGRARGENFYSRILYEDGAILYRRIYVGMLPVATGPKPVTNIVADANQLYHQLLGYLNILADEDPNAFASKMGIDPSNTKAVQAHLITNMQPTLIYSTRTADVDLIMKRFDDDNAQRHEKNEQLLVAKRLDGHTDLSDIQDVIEKVEVNDKTDPVHEIVATSVVSHGVDLERLNMEFFTGWPLTTAEYIQSSSRSGRVHPGIILVGLSYFKMYEYSIYSRFTEYHRFMERMIEAVPINRFAPNVLSRTLPGIFNAILFNWARHQDPWGKHINPYTAETIRSALRSNDSACTILVEKIVEALCLEKARELDVFSSRMINDFETDLLWRAKRIVDVFRNLPPRYSKETVATVLKRLNVFPPLISFRDIDRQVAIKPEDNDSNRVLAGLSR